jgi:acyl-CoA synthetase (AMP-forming)/AMP-acid ligase II
MYPGTHARSNPEKPAYIMAKTGQVVTYGELNDRSNQLAQLLRSRGLNNDDAIAICMENNASYLVATWAAQRSGLYYTAASSRLTESELQYIVEDCEAQVFITSYEKRDLAASIRDRAPKVHTWLMVGGTIDGFEDFDEAVSSMPAEPLAEEAAGQDMLYSSGTTGRPKGIKVRLSGNTPAELSTVAGLGLLLYSFTPDMVYLSPAPIYHAAPLRFLMAVTQVGGTAVIQENFDPAEYLQLIDRHRITHTQLVPTMFVRMLKLTEEQRAVDVSSLQVAIHAAAPCPVPIKRQMIEWWGPVIYEYYAGTEGNGFVACNSDEWLAHPGTVGRALVGTIHIVGEDGEEVPPGESGTIYFEGGATFEYHNDPKKTESSRDVKGRGWSTLGDVGYLDDDGFLYLTDRKAYMIISGGVNIYPQEAENVLVTHPKVLDAAVFGIPNEEFGEEVKAVVQPVAMADAGRALELELIAYCKEQLASLKCPRSIDFEAELPRHPTGKLYKRLLKDRYWEGHQSGII